MMSDWQPIETARKDRKAILVWCPENRCQYMVKWDDSDWFIFGSFTKLTRLLTHWRELPSYPDEPTSEPLRWVENCKPDKPGIWAVLENDRQYVRQVDRLDVYAKGTWCYLGPIPEILPPKKKVVQRLWVLPQDGETGICRWFCDGEPMAVGWIRTDETREVEQ